MRAIFFNWGWDGVVRIYELLRINPRGRRQPEIWELLCQFVGPMFVVATANEFVCRYIIL